MSDRRSPRRHRPRRSDSADPLSAHELNTKRRGELAELAFTLKAARLGFAVAKPYGDSERYDFILEARRSASRPLSRVQVKCSAQLLNGMYRVNAHRRLAGRAVPYLPAEVDFLAAYILPEDTWYILPLAATRGVTSLLFRQKSDQRPGLYDTYREAWHLLEKADP